MICREKEKGILFNPAKKIGPVEQATTAFGQGVSVTPIQQVTAVAAAVNGGTLYQPYIAKEFIDPETGQVVSRKTPVAKKGKSFRRKHQQRYGVRLRM
ncbi:hypothetical protein GCM10020331_045560 [Ectobacillus funiculus]